MKFILTHFYQTGRFIKGKVIKVNFRSVPAGLFKREMDSEIRSSTENDEYTEVRVSVPWGHVAGKAWGDPTASPLLGVHGFMDNAGTFDKLAPYLSKSFYFVAIDIPGHGFSSHIPAGMCYHYMDMIVFIRRVIKHYGWKKFNWIGHSMGAGLGSLYASIYPEEVEKLVLLDLTKFITSDFENINDRMKGAVESLLSLEEKLTDPPTYTHEEALERLMKATYGSLTTSSALTLMKRGSRRVSDGRWSFTRDIRLRNPSLFRLTHEQGYHILENIKCPLLLVKAVNSPWYEDQSVIDNTMDIYRRKCAIFKLSKIEGTHFVHLNEPEKIASSVNEFLSKDKNELGHHHL